MRRTDGSAASPQLTMAFVDEPCGAIERRLGAEGLIIGVDEVGRGPLAGPVTVCAVVIDLRDTSWCDGIDDSKKLSAGARAALDGRVRQHCRAFELVHVEHEEIDRLNILGATMLGMRLAIEGVRRALDGGSDVPVFIDGNRAPDGIVGDVRCIIGGDARSWAIGAASIIAKVARDARMDTYHERWPVYGFGRNRGYPTAAHLDAIEHHGVCEVHRRSFAPVAQALQSAGNRRG